MSVREAQVGGGVGAGGAFHLHIYLRPSSSSPPGSWTPCHVTASRDSTASEVIQAVVANLRLDGSRRYALVEVRASGGEEWVLDATDAPAHRVLLWPRCAQDDHPWEDGFFFLLQERGPDGAVQYTGPGTPGAPVGPARRLVQRGLLPRPQADFDDLCDLPELTEGALLETLRRRFLQHKIYTYAGSILLAVNPFRFLPIYNPKYVKMYENQQLGKLEPHVFALADVAYHTMLRKRVNQCIVISGESGSGKTQSTNFLIHCLTAFSQKGYASGVERTILGAGPVLEAFGNAKTAHNNNSSRFGKFIQVNYLESGIVRGAVVEKYLLEKSRLVSQEKDERNYHVFYYLLLGVSEEERQEFQLKQPEDYFYLNQHNLKIEDGEDLKHDFERLKQAMEMVGFLPATKKQIFAVLSAILYLGNVTYKKRATGRDEGLDVGPPEVLDTLSQLLKVKREILVEVLTKRKAVTVNDKLILPYSLSEAITARDSMAKSLYSALFDWIVLRINHALLNKKDMEEAVSCLSIGVLDIFGFEDFERNSFEQFCINYANEQLQYYFNQHIFKLEQEEYQSEGITWHNIDYTDNVGCIHLISKKPTGLFYLLDEESNFPHATSHTLLAKFKQQHEDNKYFLGTPVLEPAFIIQHFAGRVKYQIKDFREKNMDYMRPDIVALLRGSDSSYVRELIGMDPVAVFRWAVLRAAIRAMAVLREAGRLRAERAEKAAADTSSPGPQGHGELPRGASTPSEKLYRDMYNQIIQSIKGLPWQGEDPRRLLQSLSRLQKPPRTFLLKSKGIKQKQIIPKNLLDSKSLKLIISMTLHDRTTKSLLHLHKKKKPPSISAQFQTSLNKLLETLGQAEPFFIRCIRSNAEKKELCFDDELVLQQLRYTGMLETVRIRRSGYSAKYTFQDFTEQFQVLLPKNTQPCREVIAALLERMDVDKRNYQIGKTKVFLKETERQALQETLHQEVLRKILLLQSWFRAVLERRRFLRTQRAARVVQARWRACRAHRAQSQARAAVVLQAAWRGFVQHRAFRQQRQRVIRLQSLCRGHLQRRSFSQMILEKKAAEEQEREAQEATMEGTTEELTGPVAQQDSEQLAAEAPAWLGEEAARPLPPEKDLASQRSMAAESHDKAPSSREKRESRRQRGLEHVELQNKHSQLCKEESTPREPSGSAVLEPGESFPEDRTRTTDEAPLEMMSTETVDSIVRKQPTEKPLATLDITASGETEVLPVESLRPGPPQRPTTLALDSTVAPLVPSSTRETTQDKDKAGGSPRALDRAESPSGPTHIQRYQHPDTERLATAVELWRGKKLGASGPSAMLSQSLDLSDRHRPPGTAITPTEERRISLSTNDVSKLSPAKAQSSTETDGEPSTKKVAIYKKKSGDTSTGPDAGLSPGTQVDSKSTFKRLFLHKNKDKKYSLDVEEMEDVACGPAVLEATMKKDLEDLSSQQHRPAGERHGKEAGGKGKKNRNLKIGKITVSEKWRESVYRKITNANELKYLDEFLLNKINDLRSQKTPIESLFIEATETFRSNIKTMYSVPNGKIHVGYKDLMENYQIVVNNLATERGEKDTNMVLNLFQSLLDEFTRGYTKNDFEPAKGKTQKKKRKQERAVQEHNGHVFASYQVSIPQSCEQCLSYIWLMDKALLCSVCKMTCHKKCVHKIQSYCSYMSGRKAEPGTESGHFGVCVGSLTNDKASVPVVLEKLLEHVEMHGLYTEGLYRKSGAANRTRELRQALQTDPATVKLEDFPIHAITGVLKQWLRELPEPLMTFAQYGDFLRAVELPEKQEQLAAIYAVLEHLPEANHTALERLVFHLVKVALLEDVNRMSPGALAIIFAPCLLRCPDTSDPLSSMKDVLKITMCVEMLIKEQMRKYRVKMEEISQLEAAESIAFRRLSLLRQKAPWPFKLGFSSPYEGVLTRSPKAQVDPDSGPEELQTLREEEAPGGEEDREKEILMERIQSLKEEKEDITYRLPELDPRGSDEENVDSETSASTESLLEERAARAAEEGPPAPAPPRPGAPAPSPFPTEAAAPRRRPSSFITVRVKMPRRTPVMPTANIKLPPGLCPHLPGLGPAATASAVRRREPPARRPDHVRSVYAAAGPHLPAQGALEPLDEDAEAPGALRRYSDPPMYSLPPNASPANG